MANLLETSSPDPLTLLYCGLWDRLESWAGFVGLVAMPNRIKFLGNKIQPGKDSVTNTDLPEVSIEPVEGDTPLLATDQSKFFFAFDVVARTDNQRLDTLGPNGLGGAIFPVLWEIYRALLGYQQTEVLGLTWDGQQFVTKLDLMSVKFSRGTDEQKRGIIGWKTTMRYVARLNFGTIATSA